MTKLQVLIATYGQDGLDRISANRLPRIPGVGYLVSCQSPGSTPGIPKALLRDDVKVIFSNSKGSSVNRNILLREASAPYCLTADDDLDFIPDGIEMIIRLFDKSPELSVIALQYINSDGKTEKNYPSQPFSLSHPPKGYFISCVELAFRRTRIIERMIFFNENFGVNCIYPCGEEDLWLHDILKSGLKGEFHPLTIAIHKGVSTGIRCIGEPGVLRAQGAVITRLCPATGLLRVILKAWRSSKASDKSLPACLLPALKGWKDALLHSQKLFPPP